MHHVDLLFARLATCVWVIEDYLTRFLAIFGSNTTKIKVDCPIKTLDLVLNEERDLDVSVFEKFVHLLAHNLPVVCLVVTTHDF